MALEKVEVSAKALRHVLVALSGPPHYIRELQVTRDPIIDPENPINVLTNEFNAAVEKFNAEKDAPIVDVPEGHCCGKCQKADIQNHSNGSASCVGECPKPDENADMNRLRYIYEYSMANLVKPVMSFDEWLRKLDEEVARKVSMDSHS